MLINDIGHIILSIYNTWLKCNLTGCQSTKNLLFHVIHMISLTVPLKFLIRTCAFSENSVESFMILKGNFSVSILLFEIKKSTCWIQLYPVWQNMSRQYIHNTGFGFQSTCLDLNIMSHWTRLNPITLQYDIWLLFRFLASPVKHNIQSYILDLVHDQLTRRQTVENISRNLLRLLTVACGYSQVRLLVSQRIEMWLQNPKVTHFQWM